MLLGTIELLEPKVVHISLIVLIQYSALLFFSFFLLPCKVLPAFSGGTVLSKEKGILWLLVKYSQTQLCLYSERQRKENAFWI